MDRLHERLELAMLDFAINFTQALAEEAPVDTGFLKNQIKYRIDGMTITIDMPEYAIFIENGTVPHVITARYKKALHWKDGGGDRFAKKVMHPGTYPNPFISRTIHQKLKPLMEKALARQLR